MKKLFGTVMILSLLNLIGCYYQEQMNPSDYKFDENHSIQVNTRDTVYHFNGNNYLLKNDTLFAKAKNRIGRRTQLTNVIIPIEEVETVEVDRIDAAKTTLLVIGVVGIIVAIGALTFDPFPDDDSSFFK